MTLAISRRRVRVAVFFLAFAVASSLPSLASTARAGLPVEGTPFDGAGPVFSPQTLSSAAEYLIQGFAGGQSVRWNTTMPVPFCTIQANRPAWSSEAQFTGAVRGAAEMWNNVEAAVGVRYIGDCATAQLVTGNRVNEIAWDDARDVVTGAQAAVTQGTWLTNFGRRDFVETDIVIDGRVAIPEACLQTVVAHEIGHALGFGHSDVAGDLMAPSFSVGDLSTCRPTATASEVAWLTELYGVNRRPSLTVPPNVDARPGAPVTLQAQASDAEGDVVTLQWRQVGGTTVALTGSGGSVSFTAPASGSVTLEASATDRFLKRVVATSRVTVSATGTPADAPVSAAGAASAFRDPLAPVGVTLARWGGGVVTDALATPGSRVKSLWAMHDGVAIGYIAGAPEFVNQTFLSRYVGGRIPDGTFLAVVTGA